jgi:hypothetical protein
MSKINLPDWCPKGHQIKQGAFTFLLLTLIAVLESKAAIGAYHSVVHDGLNVWGVPLAAVQSSALSVACSLIAFFAFGFAGRLKDDLRPEVRARALLCRTVSLAFLLVPIGYLGSSFKGDREASHWAAYSASPAFAQDKTLASDMMADRDERDAARERIVKPATPDLSIMDGEWWLAAFFQIAVIFGSDALRVPAPITQEERDHHRRVASAKKGVETRKRNKAKAAKNAKPKGLRVFTGGKS